MHLCDVALHCRYTVVAKLSDNGSVMTNICSVHNMIDRKKRRKSAAVKSGKAIPVVVTESKPFQCRRSNRNAAVESGYVFRAFRKFPHTETDIMPRENDRFCHRLSRSLFNNPTLRRNAV
jgi:hypothetical protein